MAHKDEIIQSGFGRGRVPVVLKGEKGDTGPPGQPGAGLTILGELDNPSQLPGSGNNGDGYLITGDLWVWVNDSWDNVGNIQGPQGVEGPTGATGATGPQGEIGPIPIEVSTTEPINEQFLWIDPSDDLSIRHLDMLIVQQASDLAEYLTGDEYILPAKIVMIDGTVDLGDKAVRLSTGTVLRGLSRGTLISTNTSGVVRATNVDSAVIIREVNVVCMTGPCFVLTGTIEHQLNMFFCGMFGAKAAIITGFDVQAIKQCFISAADGITFNGTTNKVFVSETPFYGITGSAMTLAAGLAASVADIVTSFFKFDSPGVGITAETGYSVGEGKIRGSLIDGTAVPLDGLHPSDLNWFMTDNSGVRDSRYAGGLYLTTEAETTISTVDTPVKVAGTTTGMDMNERFTATNNRLTYNGKPPVLVSVTGTYSVDTGNNVDLSFYIAKNGTVQTESRTRVRVGSGNDERAGAIATLVEMETDDYIEVWVENNSGTANLTCKTLTLNGKS